MRYHRSVACSFVLDTDVIVAAFRSGGGASRQLLLAALDRRFELLLSVPLMLEYESVPTRREHLAACRLSAAKVSHVLDDLSSVATPVRFAFRLRPRSPDPGDDMVLETAINGGATAIVTFNQQHFAGAAKDFYCSILSPAAALKQIRSSKP